MIVEPDFLDHWKTQLLVDKLGDDRAPLYLIRLWSHCQNRKRANFPTMTADVLKAICRYSGDAMDLWSAMLDAEWIACEDEQGVVVLGFEEANAKLFANWDNGQRGGRKPTANPTGTHGKPNRNPRVTQPEPTANPPGTQVGIGVTDREEKIREDKEEKSKDSSEPQAASEPAVIIFPCVGKEPNTFRVTQSLIDEYQESYPSLDVAAEWKLALAWVKSNLDRRKTYRGMPKFLNGWLSRANDKGGSTRGSPTPQKKPRIDFSQFAKEPQ